MASKEPEIFCPACGYKPRAEDRWACVPSCSTTFHTFWTGGICPGCGHAWTKTQCPGCGVLSPHQAWYHWPERAEQDERETITLGDEARTLALAW